VFQSPIPVSPAPHVQLKSSLAVVTSTTAPKSTLEMWGDVMVFLPEILGPPTSGPPTPGDENESLDRMASASASAAGICGSDFVAAVYEPREDEKRRSRRAVLWSKDEMPLEEASEVFSDSCGEWIVGMKVKINLLQEHLHIAYRQCPWEPLYRSTQHGASSATLLRLVKGRSPCFLVVKDSENHIFGAYLPGGLRSQYTYYGTDQALIFSLHPSFRVYASKGTNYLLSSERGISLGGSSHFKSNSGAIPSDVGLHLDSALCRGSSMACTAFGNKGPVASGDVFECVQLEVWALVRPVMTMSEESGSHGASLLGRFA